VQLVHVNLVNLNPVMIISHKNLQSLAHSSPTHVYL